MEKLLWVKSQILDIDALPAEIMILKYSLVVLQNENIHLFAQQSMQAFS